MRTRSLIAKEVEALWLAAEGLIHKEIATRLGIARRTARSRLESVYLKLGASNAPHAVAIAMRRHIIE